MMNNVAMDIVVDLVSVATTFKKTLEKELFFIFPKLLRASRISSQVFRYCNSTKDNYYAALNSAVFSDGSFCYIQRAFVAQWNFPLILESIKPVQDNLKEPYLLPMKAVMYRT
jgi:Fe-S cluster assembly scaffold protein SufB